MTLPSAFSRYRDAVTAEMQAVIGDDRALLYRIIRYHMGWQEPDGQPGPGAGGKALRPALCLMACEAVGGEIDRCLPAAAAIELIHNFSLIHDDIQDQDRERHHRPTVWTLWGIAQGINAGDGLWALAGRAFMRCLERGVPPAIAVQAYALLNEACLTIIEGQALDLSFEERGPVAVPDVDEYLDMIGRKTGALLAAAMAVGALIGSGDADTAAGFQRFGAHIGRLFQIQDDILGIWGQEQITGKSASSDLRRRKQSYPVVYTLGRGPRAARDRLAAVYALPEIDDDAVAQAITALNEAGARERAADLAVSAQRDAIAALEKLPISTAARDHFRALAGFLLDRQF